MGRFGLALQATGIFASSTMDLFGRRTLRKAIEIPDVRSCFLLSRILCGFPAARPDAAAVAGLTKVFMTHEAWPLFARNGAPNNDPVGRLLDALGSPRTSAGRDARVG